MTPSEFNIKFEKHLKRSKRGLEIDNRKVIKYLEKEFIEEIQNNTKFEFYLVKIKFGTARIYCNNLFNRDAWEKEIDKML